MISRAKEDLLTLQQYLPFTVLKLKSLKGDGYAQLCGLQQYLPFTVLKLEQKK